MSNNESKIQKKLLKKLKSEFPNGYFRKIAQGPFSHNGVHDIICCIKGKFISIEVKTIEENLSDLQNYEAQCIIDSGGLFFMCQDDVKGVIDAIRLLRL